MPPFPNLCLQMLLRGRNILGYSAYPQSVVSAFVEEAHRSGVDIFRVFDALNDIDQMRPAIQAAIEVGAVAEGALCYTGDLSNPAEGLYTLDYYLRLAESLVESGVHVLCIKDMAGLLRRLLPARWSRPYVSGSMRPCTCTPTTPAAVSSPPTWPPSKPASTPSTAHPRRCRA